MARHIPDDIRYMTHETRIREGYMAAPPADGRITSKAACRAAHKEADRYYIKMGEARAAGRAAGRGTPAYEAAVADFEYYAEKRRAVMGRIAEYERSQA